MPTCRPVLLQRPDAGQFAGRVESRFHFADAGLLCNRRSGSGGVAGKHQHAQAFGAKLADCGGRFGAQHVARVKIAHWQIIDSHPEPRDAGGRRVDAGGKLNEELGEQCFIAQHDAAAFNCCSEAASGHDLHVCGGGPCQAGCASVIHDGVSERVVGAVLRRRGDAQQFIFAGRRRERASIRARDDRR